MDSSIQNVPIVADGRVAFIDTEHWDRSNNKPYLRQISAYLSTDRRKLAKKIFDQLEAGKDASHSTSKIFEDEEDEDTSSGSSSS
jgi:hypothetical protein